MLIMHDYKEVERSIITNYRKRIWRPFMKAMTDYQMIKENDKIAVCISGGKDSMLLAKCMEELQKHGKVPFELFYLVMDPGYKKEHLEKIKTQADRLHIPITIVSSDIFEVSNKLDEKHPCYMCARMRRGFLYEEARKLGCNKIALGHHFDDVIETILLSMFYGGEFKTMMPKLHSTNFVGMELIRPLYFVKEEAIKSFWKQQGYEFINCACKFSEQGNQNSKRFEMKRLVEQLRKKSPMIEQNILKSSERVNLNTIISYEKDEKITHFLDNYEKK